MSSLLTKEADDLGISFPTVHRHYHLINFEKLHEIVLSVFRFLNSTAGLSVIFITPMLLIVLAFCFQYAYLHHNDIPQEVSCKNHSGFEKLFNVTSEFDTYVKKTMVLCQDGYTYDSQQ
jgi:hypothetical protein